MLVKILSPEGEPFEVPNTRVGKLVSQGWKLPGAVVRSDRSVARPKGSPTAPQLRAAESNEKPAPVSDKE